MKYFLSLVLAFFIILGFIAVLIMTFVLPYLIYYKSLLMAD